MSRKPGNAKAVPDFQADVYKLRNENAWKRIIFMSEQKRLQDSTTPDPFLDFATAEAKLEIYLEENPLSEQNIARAREGPLSEIKKDLIKSMHNEQSKSDNFFLDGSLLLSKINYAQGHYEEAYKNAEGVNVIKSDTKAISCRSKKIAADAFAVAGLVLDKGIHVSKPLPSVEKNEEIVRNLTLATEMGLLYAQDFDKELRQSAVALPIVAGPNISAAPSSNHNLGLILESGMLKCPNVLLRLGRRMDAISHYRLILNSLESTLTQNVRFAAARQLAELLLRDSSECIYKPPPIIPECAKNGRVVKYVGVGQIPVPAGAEAPWKPLRYCGHNASIPKDINEEILLLLMVCEAQAARDAVLSQAPECATAKKQVFESATSIYDLLTVFFMYNDQKLMICETLERALKFSFEEPYVWSQLAFSLVSIGRHTKALRVLREAARLCPLNTTLCLTAARICLEHLNLVEDGLEWAQKALRIEKDQPQGLESRCHMYTGIAYLLRGRQQRVLADRRASMTLASQAFTRSRNCDSGDHLPYFYLSLVEAEQGYIPQAVVTIQRAVRLRAMHLPSLILMALLYSVPEGQEVGDSEDGLVMPACGSLEKSQSLVDTILEEYPECFEALLLKVKLEEIMFGPETATVIARRMMKTWKQLYDDQPTTSDNHLLYSSIIETRSIASPYTRDLSDIDAGSVHASKVEQAMSDFGSTGSSAFVRNTPQKSWTLELKILLATAELYLKQGMLLDADSCLMEAEGIAPVSHQVYYMKGLVSEYKNDFSEAKQSYSDAVSINPFHLPSLQRLGLVTHYLGSHSLAEKILRDALMVEPMAYQTWYHLVKVLEAQNNFEEAAVCMATALDVQRSSPVVDFGIVPVVFE